MSVRTRLEAAAERVGEGDRYRLSGLWRSWNEEGRSTFCATAAICGDEVDCDRWATVGAKVALQGDLGPETREAIRYVADSVEAVRQGHTTDYRDHLDFTDQSLMQAMLHIGAWNDEQSWGDVYTTFLKLAEQAES